MLHDSKEIELFPKLSDEELVRMKKHGHELQLNPGDYLFQEGDPAYHFYILLEGKYASQSRWKARNSLLSFTTSRGILPEKFRW